MPALSSIEWTDATWNPVRGCTRVSEGCRNCYAEIMAARFSDPGQWGEGFATIVRLPKGELDHRWTGKVALIEGALDWPLRWRGSKQAHAERRPSRIFVNSTADLFHEALPDEAIDKVFAVMALCPQHVFQVLTKRPARLRSYLARDRRFEICGAIDALIPWRTDASRAARARITRQTAPGMMAPLENVWLGTSIEDQATADERIPELLATPAALRFVSAEPLLGPVDLAAIPRTHADGYMRRLDGRFNRLAWVITGGESGPGARECWVPDIRRIVRQCRRAGVAVYVKQMGAFVTDRNDAGFDGCGPTEWPDIDPAVVEHDIHGFREEYQGAPCRIRLRDRKGADPSEWPEDLRVREFPSSASEGGLSP